VFPEWSLPKVSLISYYVWISHWWEIVQGNCPTLVIILVRLYVQDYKTMCNLDLLSVLLTIHGQLSFLLKITRNSFPETNYLFKNLLECIHIHNVHIMYFNKIHSWFFLPNFSSTILLNKKWDFKSLSQVSCHMSIIPATEETEAGWSQVQGQPGPYSETLFQTQTKQKTQKLFLGGGVDNPFPS
jgi:hypothetical protein